MTTVIGTCIYCLKIKAVKRNRMQIVPGRQEGVCETCLEMTPGQRQLMLDLVKARKGRLPRRTPNRHLDRKEE